MSIQQYTISIATDSDATRPLKRQRSTDPEGDLLGAAIKRTRGDSYVFSVPHVSVDELSLMPLIIIGLRLQARREMKLSRLRDMDSLALFILVP